MQRQIGPIKKRVGIWVHLRFLQEPDIFYVMLRSSNSDKEERLKGEEKRERERERDQRNGFRKMLPFPRGHPLYHPPARRRLPPLRLLQDGVLDLLAADDSGVLAGHHLRYLRSCRSRSRTLSEILLPTPCVADLHRSRRRGLFSTRFINKLESSFFYLSIRVI